MLIVVLYLTILHVALTPSCHAVEAPSAEPRAARFLVVLSALPNLLHPATLVAFRWFCEHRLWGIDIYVFQKQKINYEFIFGKYKPYLAHTSDQLIIASCALPCDASHLVYTLVMLVVVNLWYYLAFYQVLRAASRSRVETVHALSSLVHLSLFLSSLPPSDHDASGTRGFAPFA